MENLRRKAEHRRNHELEAVLFELEHLLQGVGEGKEFPSKYPILFIMGCARSGTTLMLQYLASLKQFCFPTNLISRFYYAPYLGALIQKILYDLDDKHELLRHYEDSQEYTSVLGKTKGPLSPHEFWYYWKRFFKFGEIQQLSQAEIAAVDWENFTRGLYALPHVFDKPLVLKGMILNWNIPALAERIPNSYFIHVKRNHLFNAESLLQARKDFFGSYEAWYSFKPPEYPLIAKKNFLEQAADQVHFTNRAIEEGLKALEPERVLSIDYDQFCQEPSKYLLPFLTNRNFLTKEVTSKHTFVSSQKVRIDEKAWIFLNDYVKRYEAC